MMIALFIFLFLVVVLVAGYMILDMSSMIFKQPVPFVRMRQRATDTLTDEISLDASSVCYDLGCGDGKVLVNLHKRYPKATYIGIERAPLPRVFAWLRFWKYWRKPTMHYTPGDFMKADLSNATHIVCYLFGSVMDTLLPKLEAELSPGTQLLSVDFTFTDKEPIREVVVHDGPAFSLGRRVYVYEF